jgi:hypothetical protein
MNINEWINIIEDSYRHSGRVFSENERTIFEKSFPDDMIEMAGDSATQQACLTGVISLIDNLPLPPNAISQYDNRCTIILEYFVYLFENGKTFGDVNRVKEVFGESLNEKFDVDSGLWFDFSKTYWTFKVEIMDLFDSYSSNKLMLSHMLVKCEVVIAETFFPSSGPYKIPDSERINSQKEFLKLFSPATDINAFIRSNPTIDKG